MSTKEKVNKKPVEPEKIVKVIQYLPLVITAIFLLLNIIRVNVPGIVCISICELLFAGMVVLIKVKKPSLRFQEFVLSFALPLLIFMISLFSGASYRDDFTLYLAVIAIVGLFLKPSFTKIQIILVDVLLLLMWAIHPEKAGATGQYILCYACYNLAAWLYYNVVKRGQAFIAVSEEKAKESHMVLDTMREIGDELQKDFEESSKQIKVGTVGLQNGSAAIANVANDAEESCASVRDMLKEAENQIGVMNGAVNMFETALSENRKNVNSMNENLKTVDTAMDEANSVLYEMEAQMKQISGIAKQLSDISYNLTILSLNASVEAGRAGRAGAGFGVVSSNMRELAAKSDMFSEQVGEAIKQLITSVRETTEKFEGSKEAMNASIDTMNQLTESFGGLNQQFESLYVNIEEQNYSISQIDGIFEELNGKVSDMHISAMKNQNAVEDIAKALDAYSENISSVIENTRV